MTEHDPAVVCDDAYVDALADDLPAEGGRLDRMLADWRDESRR
jgi:hypothetical protein